jgi:ATP-dependent DNA ligase
VALLLAAETHKLEGIVSKRADMPYRSGRRPEWIKVKTAVWQDANQDRYEKLTGG